MILSKGSLIHLIDDISPLLLSCTEATVFQHAIHITRCLGFRYVWIDALCIMQDDQEEKRAEIMRMDDIYFNSKLNISAAEADSFQGLLFDRNTLSTNPCIITTSALGLHEDISLHAFGKKTFLTWREKPLFNRGWVFQERSVSPRIIHFTKDQVFWECWSLEACEILPEGLPGSRIAGHSKRIGIDPSTSDIQQIKNRWYGDIVGLYSWTSLTFADDKLLAISAVAKRFCSAMRMNPSDYLAGMWKDDLPVSLLWEQEPVPGRSGPAETGPDLEMKYAPSWSWASVMAPICPIVGISSFVAATEVIDIEIEPRSQDVFDGTNSCRIRLRGGICKVHRHFEGHTPWIESSEDDAFQELNDTSGCVQSMRNIMMFWDTARRFSMDEYHLLHVGTSPGLQDERGLILLRIMEHGTYKRVGTFRVEHSSKYHGSKLEAAFKGGFHTLSKEDYLDLDVDGKYTVDII